jgi:hypothetical protein
MFDHLLFGKEQMEKSEKTRQDRQESVGASSMMFFQGPEVLALLVLSVAVCRKASYGSLVQRKFNVGIC